MIGIDDNIPFRANNATTNDSSHFGTVNSNATTATTTTKAAITPSDAIRVIGGKFIFGSTSLKTETIVLLLMFGICTIIYSSKYHYFDVETWIGYSGIYLKTLLNGLKSASEWNALKCERKLIDIEGTRYLLNGNMGARGMWLLFQVHIPNAQPQKSNTKTTFRGAAERR